MTGQKNRYSTTEKLWKIDDKQLKTPKHDAMILWLMDKENISSLITFPETMKKYRITYEFQGFMVKSEYPLYSNKNFIGGYIDILTYGVYTAEDEDGTIRKTHEHYRVIEVKPYIDSFGAVLRQIQTYREMSKAYDYQHFPLNFNRDNNIEYYVFTLDNRFDPQFESQMIHPIHPPENITIDDMMKQYGLKE